MKVDIGEVNSLLEKYNSELRLAVGDDGKLEIKNTDGSEWCEHTHNWCEYGTTIKDCQEKMRVDSCSWCGLQ